MYYTTNSFNHWYAVDATSLENLNHPQKTPAEYFPIFSVDDYEEIHVWLEIKDSESLNMEAGRESGLSEGERFTLANFSYSNSVIVQLH